ncbi:Eco29kI family restriction endonuclease [Mycobacteroides abscessus]|uniref:Eco29kI family restriction endonuclease n=1 Tax=Mycobacteroides abscessus TaxID=36809 RepID=UPI000C2645F3|nr:Eco29kI family restriction endonuclease [Mycobacteroides abscessus]
MSEVQPPAYFDPLSTEGLTNVVCAQFERSPRWNLTENLPAFSGDGLYALYFVGKSKLYGALSGTTVPLYIGKSTGVRNRINRHRRMIGATQLAIEDFAVGALLMPKFFVALGEKGLEDGYQPVWNVLLTGFGGNIQGIRRDSSPSKWDTLHPGRYVESGPSEFDPETLAADVAEAAAVQVQLTPPWH